MKSVIKLIIMLLTVSAVSAQSFKITHPNGGEKFGIGTDKMITWDGCEPEDEVTLEYSTNGGKEWIVITETATGFQYEWRVIPNTLSDKCLLKASLNDSTDNDVKTIGFGDLRQIIYSPDGTKLASCGSFGIYIWNIATADTILSIIEYTGEVLCIAYSPDGNRLASGSRDGTVKIWDSYSGANITTLSGHTGDVNSVVYSRDGRLASGSWDGTVRIRKFNKKSDISDFVFVITE